MIFGIFGKFGIEIGTRKILVEQFFVEKKIRKLLVEIFSDRFFLLVENCFGRFFFIEIFDENFSITNNVSDSHRTLNIVGDVILLEPDLDTMLGEKDTKEFPDLRTGGHRPGV